MTCLWAGKNLSAREVNQEPLTRTPKMAQLVLSVNPSSTPVPWGPLVLANWIISQGSSTVVETKFDPNTPTLTLTSGAETIATDPLEAIERIGAAAEIAGDSSKVCLAKLVRATAIQITCAPIS